MRNAPHVASKGGLDMNGDEMQSFAERLSRECAETDNEAMRKILAKAVLIRMKRFSPEMRLRIFREGGNDTFPSEALAQIYEGVTI